MKVMDVMKAVKSGAKVMVTLPTRDGCEKKYSLTDGTEVSRKQFDNMRDFLRPSDAGLIPGAEPQSYEWAG